MELTGPQIRLFNSEKLGQTSSSSSSSRVEESEKEDNNSILHNEILPMLSSCLRQKGEVAKKTLEATIYEALKELLENAEKRAILDDVNPILFQYFQMK